jgi:ABC-type phosphate transport system substrate-binding protein
MAERQVLRISRYMSGCLLAATLLACLPLAQAQQVAIIVNKTNDVGAVPLELVKKIFLGDKSTWPNGKHIAMLTRPSGQSEREIVLKQIYKMGEADYNKFMMQAAFTGRIPTLPREVGSPAEMKRLVAENPGAIGYVKKEEADDSVKTVLTIP